MRRMESVQGGELQSRQTLNCVFTTHMCVRISSNVFVFRGGIFYERTQQDVRCTETKNVSELCRESEVEISFRDTPG